MQEQEFSALEAKVDELIALCDKLARENKQLREDQKSWMEERSRLVERSELAKSKIDATLSQLKSVVE